MANPLDNPLDAPASTPSFTPPANAPFGLLTAPKPGPVNFTPVRTSAAPQSPGFDATPVGKVVNTFAAVPEATVDTGKTILQSLFRIPAEFGISAGQAGAAIADNNLGTDYLQKATQPISTEGLSALLGSEPLQGYGPQVESLSKSISGSSFAKSIGLDKYSFPLAFAGVVGGNAINFDGAGGEAQIVERIAKETDPARIFVLLTDSGVDKNLASKAANHLADVTAPSEIKATLDTLHGAQAIAEVTHPTPALARAIQEQYPDIQYAKIYDIAERANALPEKTPEAVEQFVTDEVNKIPEGSIPHYPDLTNERARAPEIKAAELPARIESPITPPDIKIQSGEGQVVKAFDWNKALTPEAEAVFNKVYKSIADALDAAHQPLPEGITGREALNEINRAAPLGEQHEYVSQVAEELKNAGYTNFVRTDDKYVPSDAYREFRQPSVRVGEGTQQSAEAKAAQAEAAAAAGPRSIEDKVPMPPSIGDIIANGKRIAIERTPAEPLLDLAAGSDAKSWQSLVKGYMYNAKPNARAHIFDYLATPEFVLEKVGLGKGAEMLQDAKDVYRTTLRKEFKTINDWQDRVANQVKDGQTHTQQDTARLIFQYLDGKEKDVVPEMTAAEHEVAHEIRVYLTEWADRLKLPQDNQISRYITHIFERGVEGKDNEAFLDPELSALMAEQPAKSVYDPFLEKRLGKQGYIEDVWRALDAYVKRASRKEAMDPALDEVSRMAKNLDEYTYKYVTQMSHRVNLRPTEIEKGLDNFIKQTRFGYRFTERPTSFISRKIRQLFYRGTLGLNFSSAIRNLTQGANTYAKLGEKYTVVGYAKLFGKMASRDLEELYRENILGEDLLQDKKIGALKSTMKTIDSGLFSMFEFAEKINRGSAYFGAKAQALNKGLPEEEAIKYAKRVVRETQFAFGAVDTPVFLNDDALKTLTQLQTYNIKQFEFLGRMLKQKDFAGLARWTAASFGMVYTIGRLFGMTPSQLIPTIGLGGAPLTSTAIGIGELFSSDAQTHAKGVSQLQRNLTTLIPGGAQLRKTIQGAHDLARGRDVTATGRFRFRVDPSDAAQALIFGPSALPQAQKYYDSLGKKKAPAGNPLD